MHGGRRRSLGGDAIEVSTNTALARLGVVTLDSRNSTGPTRMRYSPSTWRCRRAPALFGRVVVMVRNMSPQQVLTRKRLLANITDKPPTQRVRLHMADKMLGPGVGPAAISAGIQIIPTMVGLRSGRSYLRCL